MRMLVANMLSVQRNGAYSPKPPYKKEDLTTPERWATNQSRAKKKFRPHAPGSNPNRPMSEEVGYGEGPPTGQRALQNHAADILRCHWPSKRDGATTDFAPPDFSRWPADEMDMNTQ